MTNIKLLATTLVAVLLIGGTVVTLGRTFSSIDSHHRRRRRLSPGSHDPKTVQIKPVAVATSAETTVDAIASSRILPKVQFVFVMGIEGVGHHMFSALYQKSPSADWLRNWNMWELGSGGTSVFSLSHSLWNEGSKKEGLMTATLNDEGAKHEWSDKVHGVDLMDKVVHQMRAMVEGIAAHATKEIHANPSVELPPVMTIPLSAIVYNGVLGFISYPNFLSTKGGAQHYPDLELVYAACQNAQVECSHLFIHRDSYQVLHSTAINRNFRSIGMQMKTITTMNYVLHAQLSDFPDKLVYCWDFENESFVTENSHAIPKMLGWTNMPEFQQFYADFFQPPPKVDPALVVTPRNEAFMNVVIRSSNRAKQQCQDIMMQRNKKPSI